VRYLSNHSTGKQGVALAEAAWRRGADVVVVHGPMSTAVPPGVTAKAIETTQDMAEAVASEIGSADVLVMAAAPADFRAANVAGAKMKKTGKAPTLELVETPDILASTASKRKAGMIVVGFALETDDLEANAQKKLAAKGLHFIVANNAREAGAGFGYDTNRVTIIARDGEAESLPLMSKRDTADAILDRIEALL
jgi:phosphopantothenoylcysteine decarboxylase/phosphopantothenate--cysteine ligase